MIFSSICIARHPSFFGLTWFCQAIEYFQRVLNLDPRNGEVWGSLGHCFLMEDLQKAYQAYQQALFHLPNPRVR